MPRISRKAKETAVQKLAKVMESELGLAESQKLLEHIKRSKRLPAAVVRFLESVEAELHERWSWLHG
jgi:hypothetical protein